MKLSERQFLMIQAIVNVSLVDKETKTIVTPEDFRSKFWHEFRELGGLKGVSQNTKLKLRGEAVRVGYLVKFLGSRFDGNSVSTILSKFGIVHDFPAIVSGQEILSYLPEDENAWFVIKKLMRDITPGYSDLDPEQLSNEIRVTPVHRSPEHILTIREERKQVPIFVLKDGNWFVYAYADSEKHANEIITADILPKIRMFGSGFERVSLYYPAVQIVTREPKQPKKDKINPFGENILDLL